jgi:hypothetical protein
VVCLIPSKEIENLFPPLLFSLQRGKMNRPLLAVNGTCTTKPLKQRMPLVVFVNDNVLERLTHLCSDGKLKKVA